MKLKTAKGLLQINLQALAIFDANNTTMTVQECATFLQVHPKTVINKIESGKIYPTSCSDGKYQIPKIQFLNEILNGWEVEAKKVIHV